MVWTVMVVMFVMMVMFVKVVWIVVIVWLSLMVKLLNSWIGEKDLILKPSLRLG
jgi:hypothetical protein